MFSIIRTDPTAIVMEAINVAYAEEEERKARISLTSESF